MKVIFLDVDGVLNNINTTEMFRGVDGFKYTGIDKVLLERFKRVVTETGAKIVISSSWRKYPEFHQHLLSSLGKHADEVIGETEIINWEPRHKEIDLWLEQHKDVTGFVVLDDLTCDGLEKYGNSFVQTYFSEGLTEELVKKCISLLK